MKQTSIEWLETELKKIPFVNPKEVFEQAKEMHKQEMSDSYQDGWMSCEKWFEDKELDDHIVDINEMVELPQQEISDEEAIEMLKDMNKQPMRFHCVPKEISDEEIFKHSIKAMEERYGSGCDEEIDAHFRGAVWYREQLKQINMETKKIGAWKKQTSKGEVISFTIEGKRYSMWVNTYKKEDKHPDFNIVEDKPFNNETKTQTSGAGDLPF